MIHQSKALRTAAQAAVCAGLAASSAIAGVEEIVWVEVDNSVGTMGGTAGDPTGLDGVRTFDLYAIVTPDTKVWAADFGFVGDYQGFDDNMWTTQSVYQHPNGGDVQSKMIGMMPFLVALEFDTYVGLGMLDSQIVMNTAILGANWSPSMFAVVWYGTQFTSDYWLPAVGDADGKLFLARISVESAGGFGDPTGETEWLGGMVFLSGEDDAGQFGQAIPASGMFEAGNAFPTTPAPTVVSDGDNGDGGADQPRASAASSGDVNGDGSVDSLDVLSLQQVYGTNDPAGDLNGDGIVSDIDMVILMGWIENASGGSSPGAEADEWANLTPKERKKLERRARQAEKKRLKAERKAARQAAKELKRLERERRKEEKRREKERKKREK